MTRAQQQSFNTAQLLDYTHPFDSRCWGWGAITSSRDRQPCVDGCGLKAHLQFADGFRCWRCAFWRHYPACPYLAEFAK